MSGFNEFDPLRAQEEGWKRQEKEAREKWEQERRPSSSSIGDAYEWKHIIGGCLLFVVGLFVLAAIVGWAIATFVVK